MRTIAAGARIVKYGAPIGRATRDIAPGEYVHTHNMTSDYLPTGFGYSAPTMLVLHCMIVVKLGFAALGARGVFGMPTA